MEKKTILAFNGSPNKNGNTSHALKIVTNQLESKGINTETIQIGGKTIKPCTGCRICWERKNKRCIINSDNINELIQKMEKSDGIILGSPVFTSNVTAEVKAFIDRVGFVAKANDSLLKGKIGVPVVVATKTGTNFAYSAINFMFSISEMVSVGSTSWNCLYGKYPGDVLDDLKGIESLKVLGENIAELLQKYN